MNSEIEGSVSVVVIGYDPYFKCWKAFDFFFNKYCYCCNIPVFFVSTKNDYPSNENIVNLHSESLSFSSRMETVFSNIQTDYLFFILEDYILFKGIDLSFISKLCMDMQNNNIDFLQIDNVNRKPNYRYSDIQSYTFVGRNPKKNYYINLQPSIWKVESFKQLFKEDFNNLFDFEKRANEILNRNTFKSFNLKPYLGCFLNLIDKGKINYYANSIVKNENFNIFGFSVAKKRETDNLIFRQRIHNHIPKFLKKILKFIGRKMFNKRYYTD